MKLFLIGLSGVGKTSFGDKLAKLLGLKFIDLDNYIENKSNDSIEEIFQTSGESVFRGLENDALKELIKLDNVLISCGGGTPCFNNNLELMKSSGTIIHLTIPNRVIAQRLMNSHKRPLLDSESKHDLLLKLEGQWAERKQFYQQADIEVDVFSWNAEKMNLLKQQIENYIK
ncbi:MAG: shikimate kinase [Salibacteraceae bacterium]